VDGWITAIRQVKSDPNLAIKLGKQAGQDLTENDTWSVMAGKALADL
jgi:hypothetical protein